MLKRSLGTEILWQHSLVIYGLFLPFRTSSCRQISGIALGYAIEGPFLGSSQMAVVSMFDKDAAPAVRAKFDNADACVGQVSDSHALRASDCAVVDQALQQY